MFPTRGSRRHRVGIAMASSCEKGCAKVERSPHVVMALAYCREVILGFGALHGIALYWRALLGIHCRCVAALCRSPPPEAWHGLALLGVYPRMLLGTPAGLQHPSECRGHVQGSAAIGGILRGSTNGRNIGNPTDRGGGEEGGGEKGGR